MSFQDADSSAAGAKPASSLWRVLLNPWLLVLLGPLILLGPRLIQGEVLFWGTPLLQFIPWRSYGFDVISRGFLPLWNPLVGMGAPLLANYQSAFFYPLNALLMLVDTAWGHGLLVLVHLVLSGWGMVALCRRLEFSRLARTVAGLSFSLSAYLVGRAGFFSINAAAAWLPWILWSLEGWRQSREWRGSLFLPAVASLWLQWLSGHAQTAWYSLLLALAWLIWREVVQPQARSIKRLLRLAAPFITAFLLAAPQLIPTLEYLANSQRAASVDPTLALTYSFWPWRLLGLVAPGVFGHPAAGDYWGYANFWEDALYLGTLPLLLAVGGAIASLRRRGQRWQLGRFLMLVGLVSFVFSLGKNTPVFPWLMKNIPTFNLFQAPTRWNLLLTLALPLLAAIGVDAWQPAQGRALYWLRLGTAGAAAVSGGAWLAARVLPQVRASFLHSFALAGVWLLAAGVLGLLQRQPRPRGWQLAVSAVVLLDLLVAAFGLVPMTEAELYQGRSGLAESVNPSGRFYLDEQVEYEYTFNQTFRFDTFHALSDWKQIRRAGLPNTLMLDQAASANNFDPLLPGRYQSWMDWLASLPQEATLRQLRLMAVERYSLSLGADGMPQYHDLERGDRLRWLTQVKSMESPEAVLAAMAAPEFDPGDLLYLEDPPPFQPDPGSELQVVEQERVNPNQLDISLRSSGAGWLFRAETYFPGWYAFVDGEPTEIFQADYLFQAIFLSPGEHVVSFRYRPLSLRIGFGLFIFGVTILLAMWAVERWR